MSQAIAADQPLVFSYLTMRKAVGIIGFALPFVLAVGKMIAQGRGIEPSISDYYYTDVGNILVGSLCAIGIFLMSTRGFTKQDHQDEIAGTLGGVFAIGVALCPKTPGADAGACKPSVLNSLHYPAAALLFLTLAYFCLFLFTRTAPGQQPSRGKIRRNHVYRFSGITILVCILALGILKITQLEQTLASLRPVFWLESLAVVTFGFAWLTKGEMILKDRQDELEVSTGSARTAAAS